MIRILHLTDFHLNKKTLDDWNEFYKDPFLEKLDTLQALKKIDLVVFTGDLIDKSGKDFGSAADGFTTFYVEIIDSILVQLNLDISRFIICPGNHDINRNADDEIGEDGLKNNLKTSNDVINFINKSNNEKSYTYIKRIKEYKEFEFELYKDIAVEKLHSLFTFSMKFEINGKKVGVSSINSAWRCYDNEDRNHLLIGENQINDNYKFIKDCEIKIGLIHHQVEWLSEIEKKTIKYHISSNFDLMFSGHVHDTETELVNNKAGNCLYCVSPSGLNNIRGENIHYKNGFTVIDYGHQIECSYWVYNHNLKKFVSNSEVAENGVFTLQLKNSEAKNELELDSDFSEFLNDSGANFTHRSKDILLLDDIYVYPFLEKFSLVDQEDKATSVKSDFILEKIKKNEINHTAFLGEENSGKTSLCKMLYKVLHDEKDILPVYINGRDIKKYTSSDIDRIINKEIRKQYVNSPDISNYRTVIIIDDFNHCGLKAKYKRVFINNLFLSNYQSIITWDEFFTLSELLESLTISIDIYEILKFGAKKRYELICKWISLFSDEFIDEVSKVSHINQLEKAVNSVIGKNLVPSQPIYILTILQASELTNNQNLEQSTFGHYYDVLIKSALGQKIKDNKEIEKYYSYLSELAFWIYDRKSLEFNDDCFNEFHNYYKKEYKLAIGIIEVNGVLQECNIISFIGGVYKFKYSYIYFYFIGKYLSDNIEDVLLQKEVKLLSEKLYQTESANIYLFLSHHSKSKFVIKQILSKAKEMFDDQVILGFNEDIKQINELIEEVTENIGFDHTKNVSDFKNESLEDIEKQELIESNENSFEDGKESIDSISKVNKSFKTIEILGYIIKNRYASLKGAEKEELIEELYKLGLRTLSFLFKTLLEGEDYIKSEIIELIKKDNSSNLTASEREGLAKQFMFNLLYMISYSIFKKLSTSISTKDLKITFDEVKSKYLNNNAVLLIDMAVSFENSKDFPFDEVRILVEKFKTNKLSYSILKRLGVNYMRMMPMKEIQQQKVGSLLDISMHKQRELGGTSGIMKRNKIGK